MKKIIVGCLIVFLLLPGCRPEKTEFLEASAEKFSVEEIIEDSKEDAYSGQSAELETNAGIQETDPQEAEMKELEIPELSLIMVGDILLHTPVEEAALQEDGTYSFDAVFAHMKDEIQKADLAIVNQEVILGGEELGVSGYPAFNAPFAAGDDLVEAGFDVICHGTNHALDKGKKGLLRCLEFWQETYPEVAVLGIHDSQESQDDIYIYEQDEFQIAILNYTYGTNGIPLPGDMPYAVDLLDKQAVIEDLQAAEELADFTIVCPHWGIEYALEQSAEQESWAKLFMEHGADLVIGTHPHVIQPVEWMKDTETGREMLIFYSLGNFVN